MTVCDSSMCPLRCPDRTAIRPGGGSARRDAGARDRGERASERGTRGLKREISLSLSVVDGGERARGRRESVVARETGPPFGDCFIPARARASETRETRETRRAERVVGGTGRAAMFKAAAASSQANGTSENAGGDLGSSPSWRCAARARRGGGFEVAGRTAREGRRRGRGRVDDRGRRDEWIGIIFINRSSASRGRRRARTSAKWASIELGKRTSATAELAFGRARRAPRAGSATGATRVGGEM